MTKKKFKFVTFEGGEGSGKSTVMKLVADKIAENFPDLGILKTREPGGTDTAEEIRSVIMKANPDPTTEAYLFAGARSSHMREKVFPALLSDKLVLCDRWLDSNIVYQGIVKGIGAVEVSEINRRAITLSGEPIYPNLTIFLDVRPEVGLKRIEENKRDKNRFDDNDLSFHNAVYEAYHIAFEYCDRAVIVNGERPIEEIVEDVYNLIVDRVL